MIYPDWAAFCAGLHGMGSLPQARTDAWRKGISRPAITQVARVAAALGVGEAEVIAACGYGPYATQAEALEVREERKHAARRERYAGDPTYRAKLRAYPRKSTARSPHRATLREMTPEERRAYDRDQRRGQRFRAKRRGYKLPHQRVWSAGRIRYEMQVIKWRLADLEKALSAEWMPWHAYGCWTKDAWAKRCPVAHMDHQRKAWQVRTHTRRAKEIEAEGDGVTLPEWRAIMKSWGYRCAYCGRHRKEVRNLARRMDLEVEHVVPLPIGPNRGYNVVPACKPCNTSKRGHDVAEWASRKGYVLDARVREIHRLVLANGVRRAV